MPTVSAAQAIQNLTTSSPDRHISTGLPSLDVCLQNRAVDLSNDDGLPAGVTRGRVTEIYGPPGVGKTAIGYFFVLICCILLLTFSYSMQLAVNVLLNGNSVHWVGQYIICQWGESSPLCFVAHVLIGMFCGRRLSEDCFQENRRY